MYIDIFLAIFILIGLIQGFHRGVIRTLFAILGVIIGFLAALKFAPYVVEFFENVFKLSPVIAMVLGLLITFLILMLGIRWLGKSFENTLKVVNLNFINKIAGAILYGVLMVVVYGAVIWFLGRTNILTETARSESRTYPFLIEVPARIGHAVHKAKPVFREFWDKMDAIINPEEDERRRG